MDTHIRLITKVAKTQKEVEAHFFIRKQVFVQEQRIFQKSDKDEFDEKTIPIICKVNDRIVGTVRVFHLTNNTWIGGRLAVLKEFRVYNLGQYLIKEATKIVRSRGCKKFLANIQSQNVKFFERLCWKLTGEEVYINGILHSTMQADLSKE